MRIIHQMGNWRLLAARKTAFLCSRQVPGEAERRIGEWLGALSENDGCVICGNLLPLEQWMLSRLLERRIPTVLVLAEALPLQWSAEVEQALQEQRLLVVTHCGANIHRVTRSSAQDRNELMIELADEVVVGYALEGGHVEKLVANLPKVRRLYP